MEIERKKFYIRRLYRASWFSTALVGIISVILFPQRTSGRVMLGMVFLLFLIVVLPFTSVIISRSLGIKKLFG